MKKVILISGKIHCGKNQFADYLGKEFKNKGLKVSEDLFAKTLKDNCKEDFRKLTNVLDNISEEIKATIGLFVDQRQVMLNPSILNNINKSVDKLKIKDDNWYEDKTDITRNILQLYGTEIFRKRVDDNYWVKQVKDRCIASNSDIIIITDCRFPNEITEMLCDEYEITTIRIVRNINTQEQIASHDSETALDDWNEWNYIISNDDSLNELKNSAKTVCDDILKEENYDNGYLFNCDNKWKDLCLLEKQRI